MDCPECIHRSKAWTGRGLEAAWKAREWSHEKRRPLLCDRLNGIQERTFARD